MVPFRPSLVALQKLESLLKNGSKSEIDELSLETKFHLKHRTARNRCGDVFAETNLLQVLQSPPRTDDDLSDLSVVDHLVPHLWL